MEMSNLQILLIDAHDLNTIADDERALDSILYRELEKARVAKESQFMSLHS